MSDDARGRRKTRTGKVVSDKMDKTVVVLVDRMAVHPIYGRRMRRSERVKAHDEENSCHEGDLVRLMETRPLSREKRWRVVEILKRNQG